MEFKMPPTVRTKLWVVLNEETLEIMTDFQGEVQRFQTEQEADQEARGRLEIWQVVEVHFNHRFLQHEVNQF